MGVYLIGTEISYPRLAGTWKGIFSGESSKPEPVRVFRKEDCIGLSEDWILPDQSEAWAPADTITLITIRRS